MAQFIGNPIYKEITTGQATVTASAVVLGSAAGLRFLRLTAPPGNTGNVYFGPAGVTTGTGAILPKGISLVVPIDSLASLYIIGTLNDVVSFEYYR